MVQGYNLDNIEAKLREYLLSGNKYRDSSTLKYYLSDIRIYIDWLVFTKGEALGNISTLENSLSTFLDNENIEEYKSYLLQSKTPHSTINRKLSSIRHLHDFCKKEGIIAKESILSVRNIYNTLGRKLSTNLRFNELSHQSAKIQKKHSREEDAMLTNQPISPHNIIQKPHVNYNYYSVVSDSHTSVKFAIGATILSLIAFIVFALSRSSSEGGFAQQARAVESGKSLAFKGTLTDPLGNKMDYNTDVRFRIYPVAKGGNAVYDTGKCTVNPNKEGNFSVSIGSGCGARIPTKIFETHQELYLGIKVGKDKEIVARQRIPNTALAQNTQYLQGLPIGSKGGSIPFISENGAIQLTDSSPTIESTGEDADLMLRSASDISLASGKSSDVHIISGENGSVHFRNENNQYDNLQISHDGNVSIGTGTPGLFKLEVGGSVGPSLDGIYDLGSSAKTWNNLYVNKICFTTVLDCIETGYADAWTVSENTISPVGSHTDLLLGATATSSAQIKFSSTAGNSSFIRSGYLGIGTTAPVSALHVEGALTLTGNVTDITTSNNENLTLAAHGTGMVVINDAVKLGADSTGVYIDTNGIVSDVDGSLVLGDEVYIGPTASGLKVTVNGELSDGDGAVTVNDDFTVNGNFISGAGTSSGTTTMDISGTGTANALCHGTSSGTDNEAIVDCTSSPTADFAEMYPIEQSVDYGEVVSLGQKEVTTADGRHIRALVRNTSPYNTRIIGIVSDNYGDFISVGHNIDKKDNPKPIALKGRVPVKVDPKSDEIKAGDYLTGSSVAGRAVKADRPGTMIGQALEDWQPGRSQDTVMVFVATGYADPTTFTDRIFSAASTIFQSATGGVFSPGELVSPIVRTDRLEAKKIDAGYIYSPVAEVETLRTDTIQPASDGDIEVDLGTHDDSKLVVTGLEDAPVATIDARGNLTAAGTITAREASLSGTLAAKEVVADNITNLRNRLEETVKKTEGIDRLDTDINSIQETLANIREQPLPEPEDPPGDLPASITDPTLAEGLYENLTVTGTASLFQLAVHSTITSLSDELKLSAASSINLLDGAAVITRDGNLVLNGTLIAKSGIKTNDIRPTDDNADIRAHLKSSENGNTSFKLQNQNGSTVAQIDASGSATFRSIALDDTDIATHSAIIAAADNYLETGQYTPAINTRAAAAGTALLPAGESEIIIYNADVKESSLIYLTPAGANVTSPISITAQETCKDKPVSGNKPCKPYFKVGTDSQNDTQIAFNWLIIN